MITKFKIFENINEEQPEVGDYVICECKFKNMTDLCSFVHNRIGRIILIDDYNSSYINYKIDYGEIPRPTLTRYIQRSYIPNRGQIDLINMDNEEIIYCSKNKEELEAIISANKFNV